MSQKFNKKIPWQPFEQGFLMFLTAGACSVLLYLFQSFLMPMVFAAILACATFPLFLLLKKKFRYSDNKSAGISTFLVFLLLVAPLSYLLTTIGVEAKNLYETYPKIVNDMDFSNLESLKPYIIDYTFISEENYLYIVNLVSENADYLQDKFKQILLLVSKTIVNSSMGLLGFFVIAMFSLFFFFRDGEDISKKIKTISPLHDDYDELLLKEISGLSGVLAFSVFTISILQGLSFSILTFFMDLDWVFIGVAIAVTSFIPIVGSALVWLPLSIYVLGNGNFIEAFLIVFWGVVVAGFIIDNLMRPLIMGKICKIFNQSENDDDFNPLEHTFLVILSTLGGISTFGVIGLFIGPIIAAFSISIFGVTSLRLKNLKN